MTVFLPDTSILIDLLKRKAESVKLVRELLAQGHTLACCAITVSEIYAGMREAESKATAEMIATLLWLDTSLPVARKAGELRNEWSRKGITLSLTDTLIAATALHYRVTLITHNRKDFPMPELPIHPLE